MRIKVNHSEDRVGEYVEYDVEEIIINNSVITFVRDNQLVIKEDDSDQKWQMQMTDPEIKLEAARDALEEKIQRLMNSGNMLADWTTKEVIVELEDVLRTLE